MALPPRRNIVITGGTDGIGRALALELARRGDDVLVIGRSAAKGRALEAEAGNAGNGRVTFLEADLSLIAENERSSREISERFPTLDALVLGARFFRSQRSITVDGLESTFALFYLSRYLLSYSLTPAMLRAPAPIIVNVAGPGASLDIVRWDDLQFANGYSGNAALGQGGKLNDLLGVAYSQKPTTQPVRYVLVHPGVTTTSFAGEYDAEGLANITRLRQHAKPIQHSIAPILAQLDSPPEHPLTALVEGRRIPIDGEPFDARAAARLEQVTKTLLGVARGDREPL